jgi:hypothetical protein
MSRPTCTIQGWRELLPDEVVLETDCYLEKYLPFREKQVRPARVGKTYRQCLNGTYDMPAMNDSLIFVRRGKRKLPLNAHHSQPAPLP